MPKVDLFFPPPVQQYQSIIPVLHTPTAALQNVLMRSFHVHQPYTRRLRESGTRCDQKTFQDRLKSNVILETGKK